MTILTPAPSSNEPEVPARIVDPGTHLHPTTAAERWAEESPACPAPVEDDSDAADGTQHGTATRTAASSPPKLP